MTQPDYTPVQPNPENYVQETPESVQPGGDLPTVGTHDTEVVGTFNNAGQPTEDASVPYTAWDPSDENFVGLVEVRYTGSEAYEQDGYSFSPNEVKVVNAEEARTLLGNGDFKAV